MGWLSKLLKGSSGGAASSSASSYSWSVAKGKYGCSDDRSLSSRNSNKAEEETDSNNGSDSPNHIVDEKDEYLNHHSYGQDHLAGEDSYQLVAHIGGLEYPQTYNNNNYYLGTNVFQPYPSSSDHSWTDSFWHTEASSARIQNYTGTEFAASPYDVTPRENFGYGNQHLICDVCKQQIPVDSSGHIQVKEDRIWQLKYCRKHSKDGTARCFSCKRFEPMGTKYLWHEDGRKFCRDCNASAIKNIDECGPLIQQIYKFYQELDMKIYQLEIQIEVIDQKEMTKRDCASTLGLTLRRESPSLYTKIRIPSSGPGNTISETKRFKLVSYKEVEYILLLSGCPRLFTGHTLVHEMMHVWLHLGGYVGPDTTEGFVGQVETEQIHEGLCQVMAHKWLESQLESKHNDFERKLGQHLMRDIQERGDQLYGDGFRLVNPSVVNYGLKTTLDYIRMTAKFPLY